MIALCRFWFLESLGRKDSSPFRSAWGGVNVRRLKPGLLSSGCGALAPTRPALLRTHPGLELERRPSAGSEFRGKWTVGGGLG